jgi:hypothetical protein
LAGGVFPLADIPKRPPAPSVTERTANVTAKIAFELYVAVKRLGADEAFLGIFTRGDLNDFAQPRP